MHPSHPGISLVIPVYNEIENIELLERAIITNLVGQNYEVIFVNDGSTDGSTVRIKECCARHNNFRALHCKKHAGQTAAMDTGFKHACGKYIVSMDADMQNDSAGIP